MKHVVFLSYFFGVLGTLNVNILENPKPEFFDQYLPTILSH